MFAKSLIVGVLALGGGVAYADSRPAEPAPETRTVLIQGGQGNAVAVQLPTPNAPYALTGSTAPKAPRVVQMRFGQGANVWVPQPE